MKKRSVIKLGPGAPSLILVFVVLSMSILGTLALVTAQNDLHLSQRSAEVIEAVYRLNARAEEHRASLMGFPVNEADGTASTAVREGDTLVWQETDGTRTLHCVIDGRSGRWLRHVLTTTIAEHIDDD